MSEEARLEIKVTGSAPQQGPAPQAPVPPVPVPQGPAFEVAGLAQYLGTGNRAVALVMSPAEQARTLQLLERQLAERARRSAGPAGLGQEHLRQLANFFGGGSAGRAAAQQFLSQPGVSVSGTPPQPPGVPPLVATSGIPVPPNRGDQSLVRWPTVMEAVRGPDRSRVPVPPDLGFRPHQPLEPPAAVPWSTVMNAVKGPEVTQAPPGFWGGQPPPPKPPAPGAAPEDDWFQQFVNKFQLQQMAQATAGPTLAQGHADIGAMAIQNAVRSFAEEVGRRLLRDIPDVVREPKASLALWAEEIDRFHRAEIDVTRQAAVRAELGRQEWAEIQSKAFHDIAAGKTPEVVPVPKVVPTDPVARQVQQDMDSERMRREERDRYNRERSALDPDFARKLSQQKALERMGDPQNANAMQLAGLMLGQRGGMLGAAGQLAGGLGNIAAKGGLGNIGAAAGGGTAGVLAQASALAGPVAAVGMAAKELEKAFIRTIDNVGRFGKSIMAIDADGFVREVNNLVKQVPILGGVLGAAGDAFMGILDSAEGTANRLAQYNPQLAMAQAQVEVRRILNDIQRAQRLGPQLADFLQRRQEQRERLEEIMVRLADKLLPVVTDIMEAITTLVTQIEPLFNQVAELARASQDVRNNWQRFIPHIGGLLTTTQRIEHNTRPPDSDHEFRDLETLFTALPTTIPPDGTPAGIGMPPVPLGAAPGPFMGVP